MAERLQRGIRVAERQQETDVRHVHAVALRLAPHLQQAVCRGVPGEGAVGAVEKHGIHLGIGQQLGMLAKHPAVGGLVVAEEWLVPPEIARLALPCRMVGILHRLGMSAHDVRDVLHLAPRPVIPFVPCPVEKDNLFLRVPIIITAHFTAQGVCRSPVVAIHVLCPADGREQQGEEEKFRLHGNKFWDKGSASLEEMQTYLRFSQRGPAARTKKVCENC